MTRATIDLHIETLVLDGIPAASGEAIRTAVERELAKLVADGGVPGVTADVQASRILERIDGGSFTARQQPGSPTLAGSIGRHVATCVYRGLGQ